MAPRGFNVPPAFSGLRIGAAAGCRGHAKIVEIGEK
jgi:hypothetical protein